MAENFSDLPQWLAVGGASAWAARRVLGSSLDVVGETLERWTRVRLENVARITENAAKKSGASLDREGAVPARVAMRIFEEGSYSADDFVVEYLGGVLASSRTEVDRDDRGNGFARLIAGLSTYELRHHYISYVVTGQLLVGTDVDVRIQRNLDEVYVFVPESEWVRSMAITPTEDVQPIHFHTVQGLKHAGLLRPHSYRHASGIARYGYVWPGIEEPGEVFSPTQLGVLLFFWAHGLGDANVTLFTDPNFPLDLADIDLYIPEKARLVEGPGGSLH